MRFAFCIQHHPNNGSQTPRIKPNLTRSEHIIMRVFLCGLEALIHPIAPAHSRILSPHGALPNLLFIDFITLHRYLLSRWSPDAVILGLVICCSSTERGIRQMKRERHQPNVISFICLKHGEPKRTGAAD